MGSNPTNVFKGPDALGQYFDPDQNPPLPLVELPESLNPLRCDGVRIFAKMLTALPAHNVKSLPAFLMLQNEPEARKKTIVEASSGSTVLSLGIISRALWGHEDVHAYVTNKKHPNSLRLLRFFGLRPVLYGGLGQQEPSDPQGIMARLRRMADSNPDVCYPGQYHNDHNWKSHEQWTGAQIWKQLPEIDVFCTTIGTGGCITGVGTYLKSRKPSVKIVGVCNVFGDPTPGPRHFPGFQTSPFPWRDAIDEFETVSSIDAFRMSMNLSRSGIIAGPSSGEALHGLISHLGAAKADGRLDTMRDQSTGEINCVFACADLPYQYMDLYFDKLGEAEFPSICNQNLLTCDLDRYDERWFLSPEQCIAILPVSLDGQNPICTAFPTCTYASQDSLPSEPQSSVSSASSSTSSNYSSSSAPSSETTSLNLSEMLLPAPNATIVDIRPAEAYAKGHVQGSQNVPLPDAPKDFYGDALAVETRWRQVKSAIESDFWPWCGPSPGAAVGGRSTCEWGGSCGGVAPVLVVCTDGDSGRMATAILRAMDVEAFCVEGGFASLASHLGGKPGLV